MENFTSELKIWSDELHNEGYDSICFFQPSYNIGGGPYIEVKIAEKIAKYTDLKVYFCDFENGYADSLLSDVPEVNMRYYNSKEISFPVQEKCVVLTNSTRAILLQDMHKESKIVFWHYETVPCAWDLVFINGEVEKYLKCIDTEHAITYHDCSAKNSLKNYIKDNSRNDDYIYITLQQKDKKANNILDEDSINIGFLSRLAPDKIHSLFYLIRAYAAYKTDKCKNFHIIGDGRSRKDVENFCRNYEKDIEFFFHGSVPHEELDCCLLNNVDILFAVGTSVLEGAALNIPSAALLMDNKDINDDEAIWIFNSKDYCTGILKDQKNDFSVHYTSISDMIDNVYNGDGKSIIGKKCYDYYVNNHSDHDRLVVEFLKILTRSTLTFQKLKRLIKYIPYNLLNVVRWRVCGIDVYKKISHGGSIDYYIFNIKVFKIRKNKSEISYKIGGLTILRKYDQKPYNLPTVQFKDGVKE